MRRLISLNLDCPSMRQPRIVKAHRQDMIKMMIANERRVIAIERRVQESTFTIM